MTTLAGILLSLAALVGFGAVAPVVPTGPAVSAAAAYALHQNVYTVPLVIIAGALGAYLGDLVLYAACSWGGERLVRRFGWLREGERSANLARQLAERQVSVLLVSRMLPAGRVPVLVAGAVAGMDWRRFAVANIPACLLWSSLYTTIGLVGGVALAGSWLAVPVAAAAAALIVVSLELARRIAAARR
ncbi:DedA family protein [Pilimelia columellifera]|uniref:VTT domain-containing protein n=1 Tax=Pilimelia columellifera subsp. columellifera TaxID=706583 RepID=A0ABP6ASJ2_9ACTN